MHAIEMTSIECYVCYTLMRQTDAIRVEEWWSRGRRVTGVMLANPDSERECTQGCNFLHVADAAPAVAR